MGCARRVDIIDETFIAAPAAVVAASVRDPRNHRLWWPHLVLTLEEDRGDLGLRWIITGSAVGSMEVWLEQHREGVIVHHYVRAEAPGSGAASLGRRHVARWKRAVTRLKDLLEAR